MAALETHEAVWVTTPETLASRSESNTLRRSARGLIQRGLVRGVYRRRRDAQGRMVGGLVLVRPDSTIASDAYPAGSPGHIDNGMVHLFDSLPCRVKALVVSDRLGVELSARTAARRYREVLDAA